MFSFFQTSKNSATAAMATAKIYAANPVHLLQSTTSYGTQVVKALFAATLGTGFAQMVFGDSCYEDYSHSLYETHIEGMSLSNRVKAAFSSCSADYYGFCNNSGESYSYGHGSFAGIYCTITMNEFHTPSECIDNALKEICTNGYGTWEDVGVTCGIIAGGMLVLCCAKPAITSCGQSILALMSRAATALSTSVAHRLAAASESKDENDEEEDKESQLSRNRTEPVVAAASLTPSLKINIFVKKSQTASAGTLKKEKLNEKSSLATNRMN